MEDVVSKVVLAGRDEDLGPGDLEDAVAGRLGPGTDEAEIGAALRLGEAHRARPGAVDEARQITLLERFGAMHGERAIGAAGEARIHAERHVGGADHLLDADIEGMREPLSAIGRIAAERRPAALAKGLVGLLEALGRTHDAVLVGAALLVAGAIERKQHLFAELAAFLEHRRKNLRRGLFIARQFGERGNVEQLVEDEAEVAEGSFVDGHLSPR